MNAWWLLLVRKNLIYQKQYDGDLAHMKRDLKELPNFLIRVAHKKIRHQTHKNPYNIPRQELISQVTKLRNIVLSSSPKFSLEEDLLHNIPVQQMGNYQEYLKKQPPPLRELETAPVRQHMFGNPFKVNKNIMIDEADEAMLGQPPSNRKRGHNIDVSNSSPVPRKRKPGPLPKDTPYRRSLTPPVISISNSSSEISIEDSPDESTIKDKESHSYMKDQIGLAFDHNSIDSNHNDAFEVDNDHGFNNNIDRYFVNGLHSLLKNDDEVDDYNSELRLKILKEIRKPGTDYSTIFKLLQTLEGEKDAKSSFIRNIMNEANRFKRKKLVEKLIMLESSIYLVDIKKPKIIDVTQSICRVPNR